MSANVKIRMREVMNDAWRIFRITGESFSSCLKRAWVLLKLKLAMSNKTVQFYYKKMNGEIRQAFGTLREDVIAAHILGTGRKPNDTLFTYFDTEKQAFRSFKKFNILNMA